VAGSCKHDNVPLRDGEFLDHLSGCLLLKNFIKTACYIYIYGVCGRTHMPVSC
jgi:hypothetical protein